MSKVTIQDIAEFVSKRLSTLDNVIGTATSFILTQYKASGMIFNTEEEENGAWNNSEQNVWGN